MSGRGKPSNSPPLQPQGPRYPGNVVYSLVTGGGEDFSQYSQQQQLPTSNYDITKYPASTYMQTGPQSTYPNTTMYQPRQPMSQPNAPFFAGANNTMPTALRPRFQTPGNQSMYIPNPGMLNFNQQGGILISQPMQAQRMPTPQFPPSQMGQLYPTPPQQTMTAPPYHNQYNNPPIYYAPAQQQTPRQPTAQLQPTPPPAKQRKGIPIIDPNTGNDITAEIKSNRPEAGASDSSSRSTPTSTGELPQVAYSNQRSTLKVSRDPEGTQFQGGTPEPPSQPPAAQSPQSQNVAAQFAALVAATLGSGQSNSHPPSHPPPTMQGPGGPPQPHPHPTHVHTPPEVKTPPTGAHTVTVTPVPETGVGSGAGRNAESRPFIPNGETPVVMKAVPAQEEPTQTASAPIETKTDSVVKTAKIEKTETPALQSEPVSVSVKALDTNNISATDSSAASTRETTPEVHIVPPTPVEKTTPEIPEQKPTSTDAPTKAADAAPAVKKDRLKKNKKDLNKKGEMMQGSEFDAYIDTAEKTAQEPVVEVKSEATPPETPPEEVKRTPSPPATEEPEPVETKETTPELTITPVTEDVTPQVEIKIEDVAVVNQEEEELEEGEIVDDEEEEDSMALRYKYSEDQWSPLNLEGKKHYDREFLLQFQFESQATTKPAGLPDIPDIVLDKPIGAGRQFSREMQGGGGKSDFDFTPNYVWQGGPGGGGGGVGGGRGSRGMPRQPSTQKNKSGPGPRQINLSISKTEVELHKAKAAWKPGRLEPGSKKETEEESDAATEDLYKKTRSILNKLTPQKFQVLVSQMQALKIDTEDKLKGVIDLVFEKAISEPNFSVAYANMCRCLSMFKVQSETKPGEMVNFRAVLLTRCQREFEKDKSSEAIFVTRREEIAKCEDESKAAELKKELEYEESMAKRRSLGNIRFIGELFKLKMLTENIMHDCVFKLLRTKDPESLECLCRLLTTIGKELDTDKAKPRMDQYFQQMTKIANDKKNSSRVRFMLQDVMDVRLNKWIPRRSDNNPKTIDQIHKEVAQEKQEKALQSQQLQFQQKSQPRGGRRGPPSGQMGGDRGGQGNDGWNTVGNRTPLRSVDRSIDPSRMKISKQNVDESIQLGPGGGAGRFAGWGRGSTGGTSGRASMEKEKPSTPANRFSALSKPEDDSGRRMMGSSPSRGEGRGRGGFGRPPNLNARLSQEQEREKAVAAAKAIGAGQQPEDAVRESRGRGRGSEPRVSAETAVAPASSTAAVLSDDEMAKKTKAILDEYFQILDRNEATLCVKELSPENHHHFIYHAINHVLERSSQARNKTGHLLHDLVNKNVISVDNYIKGLVEVLEFAEDLEIDIPKIWQYYGELISPMIQDGSMSLSFLKNAVKPLIANNKAGVLLAEVLHDASHREGHKKIAGLWTASGLTWSDFVPRNQIEQFLADKGLEYTKGGDSAPTTPTTGLPLTEIADRLHDLINARREDNETVFDWIESNVDEPTTKKSQFIRVLMSAVCQSAIKGEKGKEKLEPKDISSRNDLLQKYLDHKPVFELQALFALQVLVTRLEHPQGLLRGFFDILYDEDIITEDAFIEWERSEDEPEGKGTALKQVVQFFTWLKEAEEDS
ncbi:eukaryotic translation initiation factor 4 gamma 1-like isoform X2 [Mya arenaria]|uniref:eukaryotic translation initiation factor 4 gamma 1-like isoform X2 n=1 Tax=Mya arenaria TaxID=6604 RepID=UPI0022E43186|nr:eukaryotic translation initiation factor 4 gamma 1-like isoform X2 [Mya arenaria]